ncbi:hypothetical protein [Thermococcus sp.]
MEVAFVVLYALVAVFVGVTVFIKTLSWFQKMERFTPFGLSRLAVLWGFLAFIVALAVEGIALFYLWRTSKALAFIALAILVGPIEEFSKLMPFIFRRSEGLPLRLTLTLKTALAFGVIEGLLYFLALLASGNLVGAFLRLVVITFHVVWTSFALEKAVKGSLVLGYLKASVVHSLYDAPLLLYLAGAGPAVVPLVLIGIVVLVYVYKDLDSIFMNLENFVRGELISSP